MGKCVFCMCEINYLIKPFNICAEAINALMWDNKGFYEQMVLS